MQRRLTKFLDQNKIIYEHQFGFQKNKSTTLVILDLYSQILQTLEKKKIACSVFLDFAKAFHTVDHEILTKNLNIMESEELLMNGLFRISVTDFKL